jgi:hypothetical protein
VPLIRTTPRSVEHRFEVYAHSKRRGIVVELFAPNVPGFQIEESVDVQSHESGFPVIVGDVTYGNGTIWLQEEILNPVIGLLLTRWQIYNRTRPPSSVGLIE